MVSAQHERQGAGVKRLEYCLVELLAHLGDLAYVSLALVCWTLRFRNGRRHVALVDDRTTESGDPIAEDYPLFLTTGRVVSQYLTGTQTRRIGPLVDQHPEPRAELHPRLASEHGIEPERPPYQVREGGSRICFVRDPDDYRIELIERR